MGRSILAGQDRMSLENGFDLRLLSALDGVIAQYSEADLRRYREGLPHL